MTSSDRLSYEEVVERLVRASAQLNDARLTLRALAASEGDVSLTHLVAVWRCKALEEGRRAEALGTRLAFAHRAIRALMAGEGTGCVAVNEYQRIEREAS